MIARPPGKASVSLHGGKGAALLQLSLLGYNVPPFLIIEAPFFEGLKKEERELSALQIEKACAGIPAKARDELNTAKGFAVRSSSLLEDSAAHSFAGQFKTLLNVTPEALPEAIAEVYRSGYAATVATYKAKGGISAAHSMAMIIQEMVPADAAGVGFGIHPLTGDTDTMVINAIRGLGESLVSGEVNADSYEIHDDSITQKLSGDAAVLSQDQIMQVAAALKRLAADFDGPQDIEFAFAEEKFYLLQSRPITARSHEDGGPATVWDNSNIVESYPGLTLPLTFSFIGKMYAAVYRQFSLVLGVRAKKVEAAGSVFASMLGLLNGRVYYNLNSWYATLALLPGYAINARYMEGMMGVKEPPPVPTPPSRKAGIRDYIDLAWAVCAILWNLVGARRSRVAFIRAFDEVYDRFNRTDYSGKDAAQIWRDYLEFEQLMLARWKAPLVNDFFAMIYFGLLKKLTAKYVPGHPDLHNELIASSGDIITTEPIRLLPMLAALIASNPELTAVALTGSPEDLWATLHAPAHANVLSAVNEYLETWGERCVAELKLETITYLQEPARLIAIIQTYVRGNIPAYDHAKRNNRTSAEDDVRKALQGKWLKRIIYRHVLQQARYFVSNRENLRYYRTRGFGLVRRMMLGLGIQAARSGALDNARDIFYLNLDEVAALTLAPQSIRQKVMARKDQYRIFAEMPLPERVITKGAVPEYIMSPVSVAIQDLGNVLQGIACSVGVVRALVRKVQDAGALASLEGCIMATYATDPGYVVLFPTATGILTERGSLLSHAAIVSREMGIPCIVGIDGLMDRLKDGDEVIMDGSTGVVKILVA